MYIEECRTFGFKIFAFLLNHFPKIANKFSVTMIKEKDFVRYKYLGMTIMKVP